MNADGRPIDRDLALLLGLACIIAGVVAMTLPIRPRAVRQA
jgi:uncharacterized membrane protein HdeD (DUF308 family)